MFDTLRKMIFPIIITVLVLFLGTIVFQWGMELSSRGQFQNQNVAAVINGQEVSWQEYQNTYNQLYQQAIAQSTDELPDSKIKELQQNAWQQIRNNYLLTQQAAKYNLSVTPDEIYNYLRYNPPAYLQQYQGFQTNGKFDYQKYVGAMADPNASAFWAQIEPQVKHDITILKLQQMIIETAHVTEMEVKDAFMAGQEKIKVGMINVGYDRFSRPPPTNTDDEMKQYYEAHKDDYKLDERATLNLVLVDKKPQESDWERVDHQALAIYDSLKSGADFAEFARIYSEDNSAQNGGDLGWFTRGQMVPEFDRQVFAMKPGDISKPIRTSSAGISSRCSNSKTVRRPWRTARRSNRRWRTPPTYCSRWLHPARPSTRRIRSSRISAQRPKSRDSSKRPRICLLRSKRPPRSSVIAISSTSAPMRRPVTLRSKKK